MGALFMEMVAAAGKELEDKKTDSVSEIRVDTKPNDSSPLRKKE